MGLARIALAGGWDRGEECSFADGPHPRHDELDPVRIERHYLALRAVCHWNDGTSALLERADVALWMLAAGVVLALVLMLRRRGRSPADEG